MKTTITLNGITREIELTAEQEKLFEKAKTGWERSLHGGSYYHLSPSANKEVCHEYENLDAIDIRTYERGFYHSTEEHAVKQAKIDSLRRRMQRFADTTHPDVEWDGENEHWIVFLDGEKPSVGVYTSMSHPFQVYFGTREGAEKAIELFGDEIKEMMGV